MTPLTPPNIHATLDKYLLADGLPLVYDVKQSKGSYLHDSRSNRDFLDLFSFFASMPLGHNHPKMLDKEFQQTLATIATTKPTNSDVYTEDLASFVTTFAKQASSPWFKYLFFVDGGALAVENALKTAFDWKVRLTGRAHETDVTDLSVIHFRQAFHGRSGYTLSLTNTNDPRKYQFFPKFNWPRITNPKIRFPLAGENLKSVEQLEAQALDAIQQAIKKNSQNIAALIIEPIQGEGGDNHFRGEFLRELRRLTQEHDILYILDEVQSGFGITGKMWCFEHFDFTPDIIAFGKKTQVCGIACTDRIDSVKDHVFALPSRINSTWGGNLIDMVRCQRYLEIVAEDKLIDNARDVGRYGLELLQELQSNHAKLISNVRGRGLMIAFDLPSEAQRDDFLNKLFEHRLIVLGCGERSIRLRPHLDITKENLARAVEIIGDVAKGMI